MSNENSPQQPNEQQSSSQPAEASPQEALATAQADAERWAKLAGDPQLSPRAAAFAAEQGKSARASASLWRKAAAHLAENPDQAQQEPLPSPRGPMNFSDLSTLLSSTKPETSGSTI